MRKRAKFSLLFLRHSFYFFHSNKTKNVPWHILAPSAVACDMIPLRASAHPRGAFLFHRTHFPMKQKNPLLYICMSFSPHIVQKRIHFHFFSFISCIIRRLQQNFPPQPHSGNSQKHHRKCRRQSKHQCSNCQ